MNLPKIVPIVHIEIFLKLGHYFLHGYSALACPLKKLCKILVAANLHNVLNQLAQIFILPSWWLSWFHTRCRTTAGVLASCLAMSFRLIILLRAKFFHKYFAYMFRPNVSQIACVYYHGFATRTNHHHFDFDTQFTCCSWLERMCLVRKIYNFESSRLPHQLNMELAEPLNKVANWSISW